MGCWVLDRNGRVYVKQFIWISLSSAKQGGINESGIKATDSIFVGCVWVMLRYLVGAEILGVF